MKTIILTLVISLSSTLHAQSQSLTKPSLNPKSGSNSTENCNTILSVVSLDNSTVYYTYEVDGGGAFVSQYGCVPLNEAVRVKLNKICEPDESCSSYYFTSSDLHGNYDHLIQTVSSTEFITEFENLNGTLNATSIAQGKSCFAQFEIPIKLCNPEVIDPITIGCIDYSLSNCGDLHCIRFDRTLNTITCKKCYCAEVQFTDGTSTSFYVSFLTGNSVMYCFTKDIQSLTALSVSGNCGACASSAISEPTDGTTTQQSENTERILVYPNPTYSTLHFKGKDLSNHTITLYDHDRTVVMNHSLKSEIDISNLKTGTYFYIIRKDKTVIQEGVVLKK